MNAYQNISRIKRPRGLFLLCPARHTVLILSAAVIALYFALRGNDALMTFLSGHVARPWHRLLGSACDTLGFSVAAIVIAAFAVAVIAYIIYFLYGIVRKPAKLLRLYKFFITVLTLALTVYAGFCLLWGVYYYTSDFECQSGIEAAPVSAKELCSVTEYFAGLANRYGGQVPRSESGSFNEPLDGIFERSSALYNNVQTDFPCLAGENLRAKPFMFSKIMSYINFTGFFFPFTGEANINTDAPACLIPSTIAHEIAHQRGVAAEDEANFVAVLSCLESGDPAYCYSACLLAYIHLGNALYSADKESWSAISATLSDEVKADLADNNAYWARFDTPVSKVTDTVYTGFLQSYGQTLGLKSYGACVDLLVAYYSDIAQKE